LRKFVQIYKLQLSSDSSVWRNNQKNESKGLTSLPNTVNPYGFSWCNVPQPT
jgi:hypothetical protein